MRSSLTLKLALLLVTIITIVMACFIGLRFWITWIDFHQDLDAKFERVAVRISATVNPTIWDIYQKSLDRNYSKEVATAILDAELADPYVVAIKVYGNFGHLFMGKIKISDTENVDINPNIHDQRLKAVDRRYLHPIKIDQMTIGNVEVFFTEKPMWEQLIQNLLLEITQTIFITFVVILFLFYALRLSLVKPLLALQTAKHALESMSDSVIIMAPKGQIIEVNKAFMEQSGYKLHDVDHKKLNLFKKILNNSEPITTIWDQVDKKGFWLGEVEALRKDNSCYPALLSVTTVYDHSSAPINRVMVIRDNTKEHQSRQIENKLQHSQRMETVGALAGGIAHDINNVLTPIMGWAEILADDLSQKDASRHGAEQILKGALRAKGMIDQIMDFSRMSETREPKLIHLNELINGSVSFIRASFPASINITTNLSERDLLVFGDPGKIEQVLINIFTNAMHAMEKEGGVLSVTVEQSEYIPEIGKTLTPMENEPCIHIIISDTGCGISNEVQEKIFEPFFSTKGSGKGNGFGLSTSMGIINMMGGTISVQSEPEKGATFHLWIPEAIVPDSSDISGPLLRLNDGANTDDLDMSRLTDIRVMLVDDEKDNLTMGENILGRFGCKTTSFHSSNIAYRTFMRDPDSFDILVTDQSMPILQGHELATSLRIIRPNLPIIVISGQNLYEVESKYTALDNIHFIRKPFNRAELLSALLTVLPLNSDPVQNQSLNIEESV